MEYKDRFLNLMLLRVDMSRGTLWRVAESVWIRNIKGYVDGDRKCHVGLSIRNRPVCSVGDMIPMLIGTSKGNPSSDFSVSGCFSEQSKQLTFFRLRPYQIPLSDSYDDKYGPMIEPNPPKRRLTSLELSRLNGFLAKKGVFA